MYEVFVNDRLLCLTAGKPMINDPNEEIKVLQQAFLDLESGRIQHFTLTGDHGHLWARFRTLFRWVEAAGGLVFDPKGRLLVIRRWGKWDLPKGKMQPEETPGESALREVEEECGVSDLELVSPVFPTYHTYRIEDRPVLKKTHWYLMQSKGTDDLVPQTGEGIGEALWMERSRWPEIHANTYANISRLIQAQT